MVNLSSNKLYPRLIYNWIFSPLFAGCNVWRELGPRKCRPPRIGEIPKWVIISIILLMDRLTKSSFFVNFFFLNILILSRKCKEKNTLWAKINRMFFKRHGSVFDENMKKRISLKFSINREPLLFPNIGGFMWNFSIRIGQPIIEISRFSFCYILAMNNAAVNREFDKF